MTATRGTKAGSDWEVAKLRYDRNPMDSRWMAALAPKRDKVSRIAGEKITTKFPDGIVRTVSPAPFTLDYTPKRGKNLFTAHFAFPAKTAAKVPAVMVRDARSKTGGRVWAEAVIPGTYWVLPESPSFPGEMRVGQYEGSRLVVGEISFNALGKCCHSDGTLCEVGCERCKAAADAKLAPVDINGKTEATKALDSIADEARAEIRRDRREMRSHRRAAPVAEVVRQAEAVETVPAEAVKTSGLSRDNGAQDTPAPRPWSAHLYPPVPAEVAARRAEIRQAATDLIAPVAVRQAAAPVVAEVPAYIGHHRGQAHQLADVRSASTGRHTLTFLRRVAMLTAVQDSHRARYFSPLVSADDFPPMFRSVLAGLTRETITASGDLTADGQVIMSDGSARALERKPCGCSQPCRVHTHGIYRLTA